MDSDEREWADIWEEVGRVEASDRWADRQRIIRYVKLREHYGIREAWMRSANG